MMRVLMFILLLTSWDKALANPIVADLSVRSVDIDHNFDGLDILMFGAQNGAGRIVVSLKGPKKNYIVRKKERIAGIWVNRKSIEFENVNSLYAIAATHPLSEIRNDNLLNNFNIGLENLDFQPVIKNNKYNSAAVIDQFHHALVDELLYQGLYVEEIGKISFWGESLFRTSLYFPKSISKGWYNAEVYLFSDGTLSTIQSTPIHVSKTGLSAYIFDSAHYNSLLYGLACILMAVSAGWIANITLGKA